MKGGGMHAFIEKFLANILVETGVIKDYDTYSLSTISDGELAIVDIETFEKVKRSIESIAAAHGYDCVEVVPTSISGTQTLLHPFWINKLLFDCITPGSVKESPKYLIMREERFPYPEFNQQNFIHQFKNALLGEASETQSVEIEARSTVESETQPVEVESQPIEVETQHVLAEECSTYKQIKDELTEFGIAIDKAGEYFFQSNCIVFEENLLKYLALKIKKNIICINKGLYNSVNAIKEKLEKFKIDNQTIILFVYPALSRFVQGPEMFHTLFGFNFRGLRQLHYENSSFNKHAHPMGAAFSEFDYIYRDFKTGIIWALQSKNNIYFMIDKMDQLQGEFLEVIIKELADRFMGSLSYEEMVKRDVKYFQDTTKNDKNLFVEAGVSSSKSLINLLKKEYAEIKEKYTEALNNALEYGRMAQRVEEMIVSFDEKRAEQEEREKCEKIFDELQKIPKVLAVKIIDKHIHVYTKNIYVKHETYGTWHDIGTFHIVIGMFNDRYDSNNTIRIYNTKHQIHAFNELMQAPHVFDDGHICHGNMIGMMIDAYKRRDFFQIITMIILFLENVNLDDPAGAYLNRWPVVSEEKAKNDNVIDECATICKEKTEEEEKFDNKLDIPIHIGG